jgi:hypothetical protein
MDLRNRLCRMVRANVANILVGVLVAVTVAVVLTLGRARAAPRHPARAPIPAQLLPVIRVLNNACQQPDSLTASCAIIRVAIPGRHPAPSPGR